MPSAVSMPAPVAQVAKEARLPCDISRVLEAKVEEAAQDTSQVEP